jgi:hypothetical protein
MARENRLWEWIRDGLKGTRGLHLRRVENLVSTGDPDVDGCYLGRYFEVELKGCNRPVRGGCLDFEVRPSQVAYHRRRLRAGGNTWIYVRVGQGRDVRRYLVHGANAPFLYDGVTEHMLAAIAVLPAEHTAQEFLACVSQQTP